MKKISVIHPLLFAIYPILFLFARNIGQFSTIVIVVPILAVICFTLLFWLLVNFLYKDRLKSGLIVSLFLCLFFSFGHFYLTIKAILSPGIVFMLWLCIFIFVGLLIKRTRVSLRNVNIFMNIAAFILITFPFVEITNFKLKTSNEWRSQNISALVTKSKIFNQKPNEIPDIYFIVLDAYAREDILKEFFNFENTEFFDYLGKNGFYIANKSTANYCQTSLSLASTFNLRYLDDVAKEVGKEVYDLKPLMAMINNSFALHFLRQHGYKIVAFSNALPDGEIKNADIYLSADLPFFRFRRAILNTTPIPFFMKMLNVNTLFEMHRKRLLFIFDNLADVPKLKSPVFVYAHIEAPHPPFVFGPSGERINPEAIFDYADANWLIRGGRLTRREYIKGYRDQLIFINKKIKTVIGRILAQSERPPIIILQSDHGSRSKLVWEDPNNTSFKECLSILNAYYLPNDGHENLYDEITPVNTFRVIFNHYFGTNFELLKDDSFFSTARHPYKFINVTDKIK